MVTGVLQPGIRAPEFLLPAVNQGSDAFLTRNPGQLSVLLFFPCEFSDELGDVLAKFQQRLQEFKAQNARVSAISDDTQYALRRFAQQMRIEFPMLKDCNPIRGTSRQYGVTGNDGIKPTAFLVDEEGLIRRVFRSDSAAGLPDPAIVLRAIYTLANAPKVPPLTQDDWQSGSPKAPVILIEYADYQCGHCQELHRVLKRTLPSYVDKTLLVFRHFPLRHSHPLAQLAAEAAEAAGAQGKFWEMHTRLFEANSQLEEERLVTYAQEIGLDLAKFADDLHSHHCREAVEEDFRGATRNRIKFPPALFINEILIDGSRTEETIRARIDSLLACIP